MFLTSLKAKYSDFVVKHAQSVCEDGDCTRIVCRNVGIASRYDVAKLRMPKQRLKSTSETGIVYFKLYIYYALCTKSTT